MLALAVALLPAASLSSPAADEAATRDQEAVAALTQGAAVAASPATETLRGVVDSVDQGNDAIKIRLPTETTEQFKVQDGLIFNAVRYGDQVEVTIQKIAGAKTIVGLSKK
jgi:Cu/Ag efflux protein CusF